jgi:hypothetical protein
VKRLWAGLALILAYRLAWYFLIPFSAEDAYITFHGVLDASWRASTTSPLWGLAISPFGNPEASSRVWCMAADIAAVWAAWRVLGALGYWAFLALWSTPFFVGSSVSGLETHAVAAAMLVARVWPGGYAIAAALRPDAAFVAFVACGRRWRWAMAGVSAMLVCGIAYTGHALPQTVSSKLASYGIHPGAWGWFAPLGFGALSVPLLFAFTSKARLHVAAACGVLLAYCVMGVPQFWWYAVPPLAMLGLAACEAISRQRQLIGALVVIAAASSPQWDVLHDRVLQERRLWAIGERFAALHPIGTVMLEPMGMIPFENPQLKVIDDVGLHDPWMAKRRAAGPGWRTDALKRYKPEWLILRLREYVSPDDWTVGPTSPYYGPDDARVPNYLPRLAPGLVWKSPQRFTTRLVSSNLVVLHRTPGLTTTETDLLFPAAGSHAARSGDTRR